MHSLSYFCVCEKIIKQFPFYWAQVISIIQKQPHQRWLFLWIERFIWVGCKQAFSGISQDFWLQEQKSDFAKALLAEQFFVRNFFSVLIILPICLHKKLNFQIICVHKSYVSYFLWMTVRRRHVKSNVRNVDYFTDRFSFFRNVTL